MPTELDELKHIHAELVELGKVGIRLNALIEKWPMLYKRRPEYERTERHNPGVIAGAAGPLSDTVPIAGEFEADGRPWLDANGNPKVNSAGEPFRIVPGWRASTCLLDGSPDTSAAAQEMKGKATESLTILGRFLPPDAPSFKLSGDSVGRWLLHLAHKCASGAAGRRHQTQWELFGWGANGGLITFDPVLAESSAAPPFDKMLQSLGDPAPQRIEIADVIGASQVVLADWIAEIEMKATGQAPEIDSKPDDTIRRFAAAFTFPGEKRAYVEAVDRALQKFLAPDQIFYDNRYEYELARVGLDTHLQAIYRDQAELIVVFLCKEYEQKQWCRTEWRAVRDLIMERRDESIMFFRFDHAKVSGLFSSDGYIDATHKKPEQAAELIYKRLLHNRGQTPNTAEITRDGPPSGIDPAAASPAAASSPSALKGQIVKFLNDTNPEILERVRGGHRQVCVMLASHRISDLHNLLGTEKAKEFVTYESNGSVIMGIGNRIGNCINDLCEGDTRGFNLTFTGDWQLP